MGCGDQCNYIVLSHVPFNGPLEMASTWSSNCMLSDFVLYCSNFLFSTSEILMIYDITAHKIYVMLILKPTFNCA